MSCHLAMSSGSEEGAQGGDEEAEPGSGWPERGPGAAARYLVSLERCTCCTPAALARGDGDSPDRDPPA